MTLNFTLPSVVVHVHVADPSSKTDHAAIMAALATLLAQGHTIMSNIDDLNAALDEANTTTNEIAADIAEIQAQLAGGVSAAEADALSVKLGAHVTALKAVANLHPVPPVA